MITNTFNQNSGTADSSGFSGIQCDHVPYDYEFDDYGNVIYRRSIALIDCGINEREQSGFPLQNPNCTHDQDIFISCFNGKLRLIFVMAIHVIVYPRCVNVSTSVNDHG